MKLILILGLILSQAPGGRQSAANSNRRWHAAIFRGMTVGKSKRADMLRLLGEPKWSRNTPGEDEEHGTTWNHYERIGEFPGLTNVANDSVTGTITRIEFYPDRLTKAQAVAHFGRGYIVTRYAFEPCFKDEESEPIYESPNGPLVSVEYRARGIAISIGHLDLVTRISYVDGPIGSVKSKCN